ncbi:hypothetical protein HYZ05_02755 [Candidatus Daviesbacteria bacterium]|nr:hypothetical protein [Candidatus Daviesbacteria bacterium]
MKKRIALMFFLILPFFWIFWLPGPRVATDYHLTTKETQLDNLFPWIWRETSVADGLGEYTAITLWSQPLHSFFASLYQINLPFSFLTKLLVGLIILLSIISMLKLLDYLKIKSPYQEVGVIFYILNTFFLLLLDGGQLALTLAYAVFPLSVYCFLLLMQTANLKRRLLFAFSVLAISIFDIRIVYLLFMVCAIFVLFKFFLSPSKKEVVLVFKEVLLSAIFTILIIFPFHAYWILPALVVKTPQLPQTYERVSQIDFLSFSTLLHSLILNQPHWYKNIFGKISEVSFEFLLIPATAFISLALVRRNTQVAFWSLIAILGIFLSKGSNPPLPQIYSYLFASIPGFSIFRDPAKFYFLICIAYTILIGFSLQAMGKLAKIIPFVFLLYIVWLARPVYLGQMSGLFSFPSFEKEFNLLSEVIKEDKQFSRVFWIPNSAPLGYVGPNHPQVEASRLSKKRPFAAATVGTYETFNFLREAPFMGEIFDVSGIGYIAYPYIDKQREEADFDKEKYYYTFLNQLSKLPWVSKVEYSGMPLLKVKNHQDKFFVTGNTWWIIGDDSLYKESTKSATLKLSKNSLIFTEEHAGLGKRLDEVSDAKIILNKKSNIDLAASFIDASKLFFPAKSLNFSPDESGWWKREAVDLVWWRDFLQNKYGIDNKDFDLGGGWAVGEGYSKFKVQSSKFKKDNILLARVMESSRSGNLKFYQDNQLIGEVGTKINGDANVRWFEVGELSGNGSGIAIESTGDINVVNTLAVLDKNDWDSLKDKADKLQGRVVSFDDKSIQNVTGSMVSYRRINPTKYIVNIDGLTKPSLLVFSQNYDSLWKMSGQTPLPRSANMNVALPVYSLLNGFRVEQDGEYIVEFEAQKYVYLGLAISIMTLLTITFLLILGTRRSSRL